MRRVLRFSEDVRTDRAGRSATVIRAFADLARANHPGGAQNQAEALRAEGIQVTANEMGEMRVDLARYGWFPSELPSEAGGGGDEDEDGSAPGD